MKRLTSPVIALLTSLSVAAAAPPETPEEAVAAFKGIWKDSLAKKLETSSHIVQLTHQVFETGRVKARRVSSEVSHKLVTMSLSADEKKRLILVGSLDDLKPDRKVWAVTNPGDIGNGFEAYLDPKDGRLLFLWIVPEG